MNNKLITLGVVVAVALASLSLYSQVKDEAIGAQPQQITEGDCFVSPQGVRTCEKRQTMVATSSVVCALRGPSATSTLVLFKARVNSNGLGDQTFDVSTSSTAIASSSPAFIRAGALADGAQKDIVWTPLSVSSTTGRANLLTYDSWLGSGENPFIVAPNQYITMRIATGTPGTFGSYLSGHCSASFVY